MSAKGHKDGGTERRPLALGFGLGAYRLATRLVGPALPLLLHKRLKRGKEDAARIGERKGIASRPRPEGPLIWLHAASVGESLSVTGVIEHLLAARDDLHILVTTGTVTSAELMAKNLSSDRAFHQFAPLDHPTYCSRFMAHWRPDVAVWVESEFWPNMIRSAYAQGAKLALINARFTEKSYRGWKRFPGMIASLFGCFSVMMAQDAGSAERLQALGAHDVETPGNLKHDAPPLSADETELEELRAAIAGRPVWLATNTHEGEESIALHVHEVLKRKHPRLLTLIVPRHPARGSELARLFKRAELKAVQRSAGDPIAADTEIYLADTLGELGLFYQLCDLVFIGGTLTPMGGHNPFEAARFGASLVAGPSDFNFKEAYGGLEKDGGLNRIRSAGELSHTVSLLLGDPELREAQGLAAQAFAARTRGTTKRTCEALIALLPASLENENRINERPKTELEGTHHA